MRSNYFISRAIVLGKFLYKYWMKFAYALGYINSHIILTTFYIVAIGIYKIIKTAVFLFKKETEVSTYWTPKNFESPTIGTLKRMF